MIDKQKTPLAGGADVTRLEAAKPSQITATEAAAQRLRVLAALRNGSCTTFELRDRCNVMMPAARIKELKDAGHTIITDLVDAEDSHGRPHGRVAKYTLIREAKA